MTAWCLLAPGPSATAEQAQSVREAGIPLGVVGCAFQLGPHAEFVASSDSSWWRKYPEAMAFPQRYAMHGVRGTEQVRIPALGTIVNSGVLALECARRLGATRILLLGFDMRGSHFFGKYTNGLTNTSDTKRKVHLDQYRRWARMNSTIQVINCTPGSALTCFPTARLEDEIEQKAETVYGHVPETSVGVGASLVR